MELVLMYVDSDKKRSRANKTMFGGLVTAGKTGKKLTSSNQIHLPIFQGKSNTTTTTNGQIKNFLLKAKDKNNNNKKNKNINCFTLNRH